MRLRTRPELRLAALAAIGVVCFLVVRGSGGRQSSAPTVALPSASAVVGDAHPAVSLGGLMIVVLRAPSVAERLLPGRLPTRADERSWSSEDYAAQQQVLTDLARHGLGVRPDYSFSRVLDGFSARLDPRAVPLLEQNPEVAGVYPVRVAYPATLAPETLAAGQLDPAAGVELPGFDGAGVSIALLDTGVDRRVSYLHGRVVAGIDIVDSAPPGHAAKGAPSRSVTEANGTELAGVLVGSGGPAGMRGVAPGATIVPIRVAGWQADGHGGGALYGRSDQLIAGLDRAVDLGGQGDVPEAVRVALIGLAEPFDAFADSPEAEAVSGALALGLLVVTPAGDDGDAGPWFGSVAGPGGSPAALTVGAVDSRSETFAERVVVAQGLDVIADGTMPLLDAVSVGSAQLPLAGRGSHVPPRGAAVLVEGGADPLAAVAAAVHAGARAILVEGGAPGPGSLSAVAVPVVWVPAAFAHAVSALLTRGARLELSLGRARATSSTGSGALAAFSSRGLSFEGTVDPELSAPGIEVATAQPGSRSPAYATLSGTGVAAATVAGAAALLVQARPGLNAVELASLLAGSARRGGFAVSDGGAGVVDVGASAAGEVAASQTALGFGTWSGPRWHASRRLTLHNVSTRPLLLGFHSGSTFVRVRPAQVALPAGASSTVSLIASAGARPVGAILTRVLEVQPVGGQALAVPWTIAFRPPPAALLHQLSLSPAAFKPSDSAPARLRVVIGALAGGSRLQVEPAARFEIRLYRKGGRYLGLLASLRDLLPGRYRFAITGRHPGGARLAPGAYELALLAWPTLGGTPSRARVGFRIE